MKIDLRLFSSVVRVAGSMMAKCYGHLSASSQVFIQGTRDVRLLYTRLGYARASLTKVVQHSQWGRARFGNFRKSLEFMQNDWCFFLKHTARNCPMWSLGQIS
ncbi:hypothetical protein HBH98_154420 [Parastagonospora nodorum]|nr:hypothetical protein HBH53_158020 [Parastagonospora nodorum]KAH3959352.1 hypothetical protein HBH52_244820 [Parastagonospora nodorum]KAH3963325.1 hypothetical protein HBH51_166700 [Parastagonospora nodorum]KAH3995064.1 hypothetical protein HBI10_175210 [Parastagonospora nodorum]KAH4012668.1 hypothetical protein HBI09_221750 [Parastagonospora nodorum]